MLSKSKLEDESIGSNEENNEISLPSYSSTYCSVIKSKPSFKKMKVLLVNI